MFFSVIVPIYKVEEYLRRCIDSILAQDFDDYEVILVDDGSPDGCPQICDEYAKKDKRIKVIHKPNGGLVSARQAGMEIAKGKYIINVDSDDAIAGNMFSRAYEIICETDADIVSFSVEFCNDNGNSRVSDEMIPSGLYDREQIESIILPKVLLTPDMHHMHYFMWGKAIRRELVYKYQMAVTRDISLGEDVSCIIPAYLSANRVYVSRDIVSYITVRSNSDSRDFKPKQFDQLKAGIKLLHKYEDIAPGDFSGQIARYTLFMCNVILLSAVRATGKVDLDAIAGAVKQSSLRSEIQKSAFSGITPKSRIVCYLMKKDKVKAAYYVLLIFEKIKKLIGK